jgi:hypothetical protein
VIPQHLTQTLAFRLALMNLAELKSTKGHILIGLKHLAINFEQVKDELVSFP